MRIHIVGGSNTLNYTLKDHLGSASVVTDATGAIVGEQRYYPYGETRITMGTIYTDKLYTGQREMTGLGIYHYQARFYSPRLGRFLSADTIVPNPYNPQDLNRFSYVRNNPLRYVDPTGHVACRTKEECEDMGTTPNGGGSLGGGNSSGSGGGGGGGGRGGSGSSGQDDETSGHSYDNVGNEPNLVCLDLSWIDCTEEEVAGYMTQFQYPGQWPGSPVANLGEYNVWPAEFWGIPTPLCYIGMCDSGAIIVNITNNGLTITNITQTSHIFYVGDVERTASLGVDGNWYITTHGEGTNDGYGIIPGSAIDAANQAIGPYVFEAIDFQMVVYTTIVETGQFISSLLP